MLIRRFFEKRKRVGEKKASVNSKQSLPTFNWDPLDNEVEGWFGNNNCKTWNVPKTTFNVKYSL